MALMHLWCLIALVLLPVWGCAASGSLESRAAAAPEPPRFIKAEDGIITDRATGLDWYIGPNQDNTWRQAKAWAEHLDVGGGGWRLPTVPELQALYRKDAAPNNIDPIFVTPGVYMWSGDLNNDWSAWGFAFYSGLVGWHAMDYGKGRIALAVRAHR